LSDEIDWAVNLRARVGVRLGRCAPEVAELILVAPRLLPSMRHLALACYVAA
jgi:hypothetical protein